MATLCRNCGEKLFPTDTFCGFCGAAVEKNTEDINPSVVTGNTQNTTERDNLIDRKRLALLAAKKAEFLAARKSLDMNGEVTPEDIKAAAAEIYAEITKSGNVMPESDTPEIEEPEAIELEDTLENDEAADIKTADIETEDIIFENDEEVAEEVFNFENNEKIASEVFNFEKNEEAEDVEDVEEIENVEEAEAEPFAAETVEVEKEDFEALKKQLDALFARDESYVAEETDSEETVSEENVDSSTDNAEENKVENNDEINSDINDEIKIDKVTLEEYLENNKFDENPAPIVRGTENRIIRRKKDDKINKKLIRDIAVLVAGIAILAVMFFVLLKKDVKDVTGNDVYNKQTADTTSPEPTKAPTKAPTVAPTEAPAEPKEPTDLDTAWDGSVAEKFSQGDGTEESPYIIECGSQLAYLASEVNRGITYEGQYIKLDKDLDLTGHEWTPIGYYSKDGEDELSYVFAGNFDGGEHVIKGATINVNGKGFELVNESADLAVGIFGVTNGATISNVTVEEATINVAETSGKVIAACLVADARKTNLTGCKVAGIINVGGKDVVCAGLIAGVIDGCEANSISGTGDVKAVTAGSNVDAAVVIGYCKGTKLTEVSGSGSITATGTSESCVGGIIGYGDTATLETVSAACSVTYTSESKENNAAVGVIVGHDSESSYSGIKVDNGSIAITSTGEDDVISCGILAGYTTDGSIFKTAEVTGKIESSGVYDNHSAGLFGLISGGNVSDVTATVEVTAKASDTNKASVIIAGVAATSIKTEYSNVTTNGNITGESAFNGYAGGLFGQVDGGSANRVTSRNVISNTATTGVSTGGIAGYQINRLTTTRVNGATRRTNKGANVHDGAQYGN